MSEKLALIENLRQLTDNVTRLSGRCRRLRAERRMKIADLKNKIIMSLAVCLLGVALILALCLLPGFPLEVIWPVLALIIVIFLGLALLIFRIVKIESTRFAKIKWVEKRFVENQQRINVTDREIKSLLYTDLLRDFSLLPGEVLDTKLLIFAKSVIMQDHEITWEHLGNKLMVQRELNRERHSPRLLVEWHREFRLRFPKYPDAANINPGRELA
jgi:hypothetical protein